MGHLVPTVVVNTGRGERAFDIYSRLLKRTTGQPPAKIAADLERDYHLTAEEARRYGLIDQVLESRSRETSDAPPTTGR